MTSNPARGREVTSVLLLGDNSELEFILRRLGTTFQLYVRHRNGAAVALSRPWVFTDEKRAMDAMTQKVEQAVTKLGWKRAV